MSVFLDRSGVKLRGNVGKNKRTKRSIGFFLMESREENPEPKERRTGNVGGRPKDATNGIDSFRRD
jgi:hypothetical protein